METLNLAQINAEVSPLLDGERDNLKNGIQRVFDGVFEVCQGILIDVGMLLPSHSIG